MTLSTATIAVLLVLLAPPSTTPPAPASDTKPAQESPAREKPAPAKQADANPAAAARALADRVIARYSAAKTYSDTGTGTSSHSNGGPTSRLVFRTAFRRGGAMLWSFTKSPTPGRAPDSEYVVWSSDQKTWNTWWKLRRGVESTNDSGLAFGAPAGVSRGLSRMLPTLLGANETPDRFFLRYSDMRVAGKEDLNGVPCEVLEAKEAFADGTVSMWIDASGALRKFRSKMTIDPSKSPPVPGIPAEEARRMREMPKFDSVTEFVFEPTFDAEIAEKDIVFAPPEGAAGAED